MYRKNEEIYFEDSDPIGMIACLDNPAFCDDSKAIPFVQALTALGYTGNWGCLEPPPGDFIDMRKVVDPKIISEMVDHGIYPFQKMPPKQQEYIARTELEQLQKERSLSDAEFLRGGAGYRMRDDGSFVLSHTCDQYESAREEMYDALYAELLVLRQKYAKIIGENEILFHHSITMEARKRRI